MLKFTPYVLLFFAAIIFTACPYNANVPLGTPDHKEFDNRILGFWKSPYLTAVINGLHISQTPAGQLIAIEYSVENGVVKHDKDTLTFTPTKVNGVFFLDQKSDTANLWTAHPYFFSLDGNVISTYSINDTIVGKDRKFGSTAEYRDYVAQHIYTPGFLENPDMMMRVSDGEINGQYLNVLVSDTVSRHTDKIAYSVRVSEAFIYANKGKDTQQAIRKVERQIKQKTGNLRLDSTYVDDDHGYLIKHFCFTAKNPTNLAYQKKALQQVKNIAIEPISQHYRESLETLSATVDQNLTAKASELAKAELPTFGKVQAVVSHDPLEEREEFLREKALPQAMKIGSYLMAPYETIYDLSQFMLTGKDQMYWKTAVYRVWLR